MKRINTRFGVALMLVLMSCDFSNAGRKKGDDNLTAPKDEKYQLALAFPDLEFDQPVELTSPNDGTDRIFVVAQKGVINVFPNKPEQKKSWCISGYRIPGKKWGRIGLTYGPSQGCW